MHAVARTIAADRDMEHRDAPRVLLVEDDARLAALVQEYLEREGFAVTLEARGDRAAERIPRERPDVVILDLMLPGLDGLAVCRAVRPAFPGAILMLTARGEEVDEIVGLEVGADDYLAKPVRPRLLLARLHALLRRRAAPSPEAAPTVPEDGALRVGALEVWPARREARYQGAPLDLTTAEFDLLALLAGRAGEVVSREELYLALRGIPYDGLDRSMDLRVARIRRKLGDDARQPAIIKSVRGAGYLLAVGP